MSVTGRITGMLTKFGKLDLANHYQKSTIGPVQIFTGKLQQACISATICRPLDQ